MLVVEVGAVVEERVAEVLTRAQVLGGRARAVARLRRVLGLHAELVGDHHVVKLAPCLLG